MSEYELLIKCTKKHFGCNNTLAEKLIQSSILNEETESFKELVGYEKARDRTLISKGV